MEFLYPTSTQFPFDDVCGRIVRALEERAWAVPGIQVEIGEYSVGPFRYVAGIEGPEFKLRFCRRQRRLGDWNDIAAVTQIVIPRKDLSVYDDESGPTFRLYVGDDYDRDRHAFMNGPKVNSKLYGEPRRYLLYNGRCDCGGSEWAHTHDGRRPPVLQHNNDIGREYDPEGDEPVRFRTSEVMEEFRRYLEETVLATILSHPVAA